MLEAGEKIVIWCLGVKSFMEFNIWKLQCRLRLVVPQYQYHFVLVFPVEKGLFEFLARVLFVFLHIMYSMMYNLQTYQSKKWQSLQLLLSARQLCPIWVNDSNNDITMFQFKTFVCMCSTVENTFSSYSYFLKNIDGLKQLSKDLNAEEGVTLIDNWKLIHLRLGCSIPTLFHYFKSSMLNLFNQHSLFDNE